MKRMKRMRNAAKAIWSGGQSGKENMLMGSTQLCCGCFVGTRCYCIKILPEVR